MEGEGEREGAILDEKRNQREGEREGTISYTSLCLLRPNLNRNQKLEPHQ